MNLSDMTTKEVDSVLSMLGKLVSEKKSFFEGKANDLMAMNRSYQAAAYNNESARLEKCETFISLLKEANSKKAKAKVATKKKEIIKSAVKAVEKDVEKPKPKPKAKPSTTKKKAATKAKSTTKKTVKKQSEEK